MKNVLHAWNNDAPSHLDPLAVASHVNALAQQASQPTSASKRICNVHSLRGSSVNWNDTLERLVERTGRRNLLYNHFLAGFEALGILTDDRSEDADGHLDGADEDNPNDDREPAKICKMGANSRLFFSLAGYSTWGQIKSEVAKRLDQLTKKKIEGQARPSGRCAI